MSTFKRPQWAALFAAALATGASMIVLLAVALAGPQPVRGQPASPLPPVSPLPLAVPPPGQERWEAVSDARDVYHVRLPPGWYAATSGRGVSISNYDFSNVSPMPEDAVWIDVSLRELQFAQTFAQYVARWQEINTAPSEISSYPTPIPVTPSQPVALAGYTGVSEINEVAMGDGRRLPQQNILLLVEGQWVAEIRILRTSAPDYARALQILATLAFTPRCEEDAGPGFDPAAELRLTLETVVAHELEARQTANWLAFQSLVHSETDPQWLEQQRYSVGREWKAIDLTRIERSDDWALAAAIETHVTPEGTPTQFYTTRTFRQEDTGCWKLASPNLEAWVALEDGGRTYSKVLHYDPVSIAYPPFDEPYVRAAGPRLATALGQIAADFATPLARTGGYIVRVDSFPNAGPFQISDMAQPVVPSPLWPGFPLSLAQSPEEYLFGYLVDALGHELLKDTFGAAAAEPARLALAHAAVQWEVEQATGRDHTLQLAASLDQDAGPRAPLAAVLDPQRDPLAEDGAGDGASNQGERDLFLRFAIAERGRGVIAPYLQAVFHSESAGELVEAVFDEELPAVEKRWRAWLEGRGAG